MWVGVSVVLPEDGRVEVWRPLKFFEFNGERGAKASTVPPVLLLHHYVLALFFI